MSSFEENIKKGIEGEDFVETALKKYFNAVINRQKGVDDKGIDLYAHFTNPITNDRITFGVQVKTGISYVEDLGDKCRIIIEEKKFLKAQKTNIPIMIVWVDDNINVAYWTSINANSSYNHIFVNKNFPLSPLTYYNFLMRLAQTNISENSQFKKLVAKIKHIKVGAQLNNTVKHAKSYYKNWLQGKTIINPVIGEVKITAKGFRTITRNGRRKRFIVGSLEMLGTVETVLIYTNKVKYYKRKKSIQRGDWFFCSSIIVLQLDNVRFFERAAASIYVMVKENIQYHKDFSNPSFFTKKNQFNRELIFDNVYENVLN